MMLKSGHGIKFEAPLSRDKDSLVGFEFVDDIEIVEGYLARAEINIEDIHIIVQKAIDRW